MRDTVHVVSMPHPRSHTKGQWYWEIHVNPGKAESHQRHSSVTKGCMISWVWVKQRWRFMQRQCRVQKTHLCLTSTSWSSPLLFVKLRCWYDPGLLGFTWIFQCYWTLVRLLPDTASLLRNITIRRLSTGDLPFLSPADTIAPYMACMIPLLNLSVTPW
jgi:hypothetical protein